MDDGNDDDANCALLLEKAINTPYKVSAVQVEGVQYKLSDAEQRAFLSLYCRYFIQGDQ